MNDATIILARTLQLVIEEKYLLQRWHYPSTNIQIIQDNINEALKLLMEQPSNTAGGDTPVSTKP